MKRNKVEDIQSYLAERGIVASETAIVNAAIDIARRRGGNAIFVGEFNMNGKQMKEKGEKER